MKPDLPIMEAMASLQELLAKCDEDDLRFLCGFGLGYAYAQQEFSEPIPFTVKKKENV